MIFFFPFAFTFVVCFASFTFVAVVFGFFAVVAGFVAGLAAVVFGLIGVYYKMCMKRKEYHTYDEEDK